MSSPVVVSRIQNRRGTQDQFNGHVYSPSGPNSVYPIGYTGVGGYGSFPTFNSSNYPNVLLPGELALCTDSRKIFMGNLNGEYVEVEIVLGDGLFLHPSVWELPPSGSFVPITRLLPFPVTLEYDATPFLNVLYDVTDDTLTPDWNTVGTNFSKNGELKITAVAYFSPNIPNPNPFLPDTTPVELTDTGTDINLVQPSDIQFIAQYNGPKIEILYKHDFPGSLTFSTSTIRWIPLLP
jgi:hypothetical protein